MTLEIHITETIQVKDTLDKPICSKKPKDNWLGIFDEVSNIAITFGKLQPRAPPLSSYFKKQRLLVILIMSFCFNSYLGQLTIKVGS